jgi:hypothetical protein
MTPDGNPPDDISDALDDLLDQPSRVDPFHPHLLVKASTAIIPDKARLIEALEMLCQSAETDQAMSPGLADKLAHECSSLTRKIANAASNKSEVR